MHPLYRLCVPLLTIHKCHRRVVMGHSCQPTLMISRSGGADCICSTFLDLCAAQLSPRAGPATGQKTARHAKTLFAAWERRRMCVFVYVTHSLVIPFTPLLPASAAPQLRPLRFSFKPAWDLNSSVPLNLLWNGDVI